MADITGTSLQLPIGVLTSLLAINIILSFTASLGNVLILLTLYKVSFLHPVTKFLFACLATTDLCVGLFSQPLFVAHMILNIDIADTNLDILQYVGEVIHISSSVLCGVSVLISTAISVDRLLVLLLRLKYRQVVTLKRAQVVILLCWVTAVLILLTLYKVSFLHPVTKFLFACLATTDLCVGLFSQPLFVAHMILNIDIADTNLDILQYVGEVIHISSSVLCGVSVLISTAISVDRLLVLLLRLKYRQVVTLKRAQVVILLWIGSRLESNDFTDFRFSDRIGIFSYFRVLLRKDPPETTGESGYSRRQLWGWTVKRR